MEIFFVQAAYHTNIVAFFFESNNKFFHSLFVSLLPLYFIKCLLMKFYADAYHINCNRSWYTQRCLIYTFSTTRYRLCFKIPFTLSARLFYKEVAALCHANKCLSC